MTDLERAERYVAKVPNSSDGTRNTDLNELAYLLVKKFDLSEAEHASLCLHWNTKNNPPLPDREAKATIRSAREGCHRKHENGIERTTTRRAHGSAPVTKCHKPDVTVRDKHILTPSALLSYDVSNDSKTLLGQRWICRGGSCLWLGLAGIGKSSLVVQAAATWALGEPFFGITPRFQLKSLIVQGENDDGDLAEQMQGVAGGMEWTPQQVHELDSALAFVRECSRTSDDFAAYLYALVLEEKPDLVWLDPLNCYIGGDVSSQEVCSHFLRNLLNPIAIESGSAIMVVHHGNKPVQYPQGASAWRKNDYAYFGSGSSELANWARATVLVREVDDGIFEMRTSKRGNRAGMTDGDGQPSQLISLEHSTGRICWQRATGLTTMQKEVEDGVADVLASMPDDPIDERELRHIAIKVLKCPRQTIYMAGRKPRIVFDAVKMRTRIAQQPTLFRRSVSQCHGVSHGCHCDN